MDCVTKTLQISSHMNFKEFLSCVKRLSPSRAYPTGMSHNFYYQSFEEDLRKENYNHSTEIIMPFDGFRIDGIKIKEKYLEKPFLGSKY